MGKRVDELRFFGSYRTNPDLIPAINTELLDTVCGLDVVLRQPDTMRPVLPAHELLALSALRLQKMP